MKRCIYCEQSEDKVPFVGKEHVVPKLLGVFVNDLKLDGYVCDECNSKVFSKLETKFKEDSHEGVVYQMFNFEDKYEIRVLDDNVQNTFDWGLDKEMLNDMFPKMDVVSNEIKIFPQAQIKIKRHGAKGYVILLVDRLKTLDKNGSKFKKLKDRFSGTNSSDVSIKAPATSNQDRNYLDDALHLLGELGIKYQEGKRKYEKFKKDPKMEVETTVNLGNDTGRILAKIAFNYFAYNAIKEGIPQVLFNSSFEGIKSYILGTSNKSVKDIIRSVSGDPIIGNRKGERVRLLGHSLTFSKKGRQIIAEISLLGLNRYEIVLGDIIPELDKDKFGSGHFFNLSDHQITSLTQNQAKMESGARTVFGLFNRA